MEYILLFIIIALVIIVLLRANVSQKNLDEDPELFSTEKFEDKKMLDMESRYGTTIWNQHMESKYYNKDMGSRYYNMESRYY